MYRNKAKWFLLQALLLVRWFAGIVWREYIGVKVSGLVSVELGWKLFDAEGTNR